MVGSDYGRDYEAAKQDLAKLIESQEDTARKIIQARKKLELLAALCESEDIEIEPSREAEALLSNTSIADEIRMILRAKYPKWLRPHDLKGDLEDLGHDLKKYSNPQATIHMVLKRLG